VYGLNLEDVSFLVVEDNSFMRSLIKTILKALRTGPVKDASDGAEALQILDAGFSPDIILLDRDMPVLDGVEFVKLLRKSNEEAGRFAPVIMISAHADISKVFEARDAGVNEYLVKPLSPESLYRRIFEVVTHPRTFVKAPHYAGPCRRRKPLESLPFADRREDAAYA